MLQKYELIVRKRLRSCQRGPNNVKACFDHLDRVCLGGTEISSFVLLRLGQILWWFGQSGMRLGYGATRSSYFYGVSRKKAHTNLWVLLDHELLWAFRCTIAKAQTVLPNRQPTYANWSWRLARISHSNQGNTKPHTSLETGQKHREIKLDIASQFGPDEFVRTNPNR